MQSVHKASATQKLISSIRAQSVRKIEGSMCTGAQNRGSVYTRAQNRVTQKKGWAFSGGGSPKGATLPQKLQLLYKYRKHLLR